MNRQKDIKTLEFFAVPLAFLGLENTAILTLSGLPSAGL